MPDQVHHVIDLDLSPSEASGLVASASAALRERLGLDPLYWTVLDDGPVERCIALIGQRAGTREPTAGWTTAHLQATVTTPTGLTDDGEAIAVHDGWVLVLGSSYGGKSGPLEPERSFVARFHEDDVVVGEDGSVSADLHVTADPFVLHRVVNDALYDSGVELMAWSPRYLKKVLHKARRAAVEDDAPWAWRLAADDWPVNIEGAVFTDDGSLLLGLRLPVTRLGQALIVEIRHPDRLFDPALDDPDPGRVIVVEEIGDRRAPVGVRDMDLEPDGRRLHVLLGDLDSDRADSILLGEHPEGGVAESTHVVLDVPNEGDAILVGAPAEIVHHFTGLSRVEGLARDQEGRVLYVSDEDDVIRTRFFTSDPAAV